MFSFAVGGEHGDGLLIRSASDQLPDGNLLGIINHLLVQDVGYGTTVSAKIPAEGFHVRLQRRPDPSPGKRRISPSEVGLAT